MNRGGIFLDRDGTINREVEFLSSPDELELLPGSAEAIRIANDLGFKVFILTNQSGVARGYFSETQLGLIHQKLLSMLSAEGARIDAIYYCPHHPEFGIGSYRIDCNCRKPYTGMADQAIAKFDIDPRQSFVIGDRMIDVELGMKLHARSILVKTGYGNEEFAHARSNDMVRKHLEFVAEDLLDAMRYVERALREPRVAVSS